PLRLTQRRQHRVRLGHCACNHLAHQLMAWIGGNRILAIGEEAVEVEHRIFSPSGYLRMNIAHPHLAVASFFGPASDRMSRPISRFAVPNTPTSSAITTTNSSTRSATACSLSA